MKYMFIIHSTPDDAHVDRLAEELAIRGVPSLADHRGGLAFSDYVPDEAPRLIEEECLGCLVYAADDGASQTALPPLFTSDFVRRLEVPAAIRARQRDSDYMLATVPHGIEYARLGQLSVTSFGTNLVNHRTAAISGRPEALLDETMRVARDVMEQVVACYAGEPAQISFNTWRREAPHRDDLLSIDWCTGLGDCKTPSAQTCAHLLCALSDIERAVSRRHRAKRLAIKGNFHLSAGMALGYAFSRYPVEIETSDGTGSWVTGPTTVGLDPFRVQGSACEAASSSLYVGISASDKDVRPALRQHVATQRRAPFYELFLEPSTGLSRTAVADELMCRAMADQARRAIAEVVSRHAGAITEIHLFLSGPKTLAVMLGHELTALPPIQLYEHDGITYHPAFRLRMPLASQ